MKALIVLLAATLLGCTVKLSGEASLLKQMDRPTETVKIETVDGPAVKASQTQGNVGVVK